MARAKRTPSRKKASSPRKRASGRRDKVKAKNATFSTERTAQGRFRTMDEVRRSLKADRRGKATTKIKPGYGYRRDKAAEAVV